jgi:hypothetical protein
MRWTVEPNPSHPQWAEHVLAEGAPLESAFVEYWRRVLTDGKSLPASERAELAVEILAQSFEGDDPGSARGIFYNSLNRQSEKLGVYVLHSEDFTSMQREGETGPAFERRTLLWQLEQYKALKRALEGGAVWPLFEKIVDSAPLAIRAGTSNGWIDLRPGQEGFGPLPTNDERLLAGKDSLPEDPMEDLAGGVIDVRWTRILEELSAALVQYTPPHFHENPLQNQRRQGARSAGAVLRHTVPRVS